MNVLTCDHCGRTASDVRVKLVRYDELVDGRVRVAFATEARCQDLDACKRRPAVGR